MPTAEEIRLESHRLEWEDLKTMIITEAHENAVPLPLGITTIEVTMQIAEMCFRLSPVKYRRTLRARAVDLISRDILAGKYYLNLSPIRFDMWGFFRDGHHRMAGLLKACESNPDLRITTVVAYGLDDNALKATDKGIARTLADFIRMFGDNDMPPSLLSPTLSALFRVISGKTCIKTSTGPSVFEAEEMADEWGKELKEALKIFGTADARRDLGSVADFAALHCIFSRTDPDHALEFGTKLASGEGLYAGDPAFTLRKNLAQIKGSGLLPSQKKWKRIAATIAAYIADREGRQIQRIVTGPIGKEFRDIPGWEWNEWSGAPKPKVPAFDEQYAKYLTRPNTRAER